MNIKGLELLIELELPVIRNLCLFRRLSEVPEQYVNIYGDAPCWAMMGFDYTNSKITDYPYELHESRAIRGFAKSRIGEVFSQVKRELEAMKMDPSNRLYLMGEVFTNDMVASSGFAYKDAESFSIDIFEGNRPSKQDAKPKFSYTVRTGERLMISPIPESSYRPRIVKIFKDMLLFPKATQVEFTALKDGYFFYHDLRQISS